MECKAPGGSLVRGLAIRGSGFDPIRVIHTQKIYLKGTTPSV